MDQELAAFLSSGKEIAHGSASWGANMPLGITTFVSTKPAPQLYVSSVRAIVFREDSVLVIKDPSQQFYITPGGRCEEGESPLDTLRRELLEETGWTIKEIRRLGFIHFHHLAPKPEGYKYPYPDFLWPVYIAEAGKHTPETVQHDDYVVSSEFRPVAEALKLDLTLGQVELLQAAIDLRRNPKS